MNDTITIKLTRAQQAAAKRLAAQYTFEDSYEESRSPYSDNGLQMEEDSRSVVQAVLDAIKKAGAK